MTALEVFEYFCGKYRIKPIIRYAYSVERPINWSKYHSVSWTNTGIDVNNLLSYRELFTKRFLSRGFRDLLYYMTSSVYYNMLKKSKKFKKASRRWDYFSKHNIIPKPSVIKVGDQITLKNHVSPYNVGTIVSINVTTCTALVLIDAGDRKRHVTISTLGTLVVNGVETEMEYAITERGKIVKE